MCLLLWTLIFDNDIYFGVNVKVKCKAKTTWLRLDPVHSPKWTKNSPAAVGSLLCPCDLYAVKPRLITAVRLYNTHHYCTASVYTDDFLRLLYFTASATCFNHTYIIQMVSGQHWSRNGSRAVWFTEKCWFTCTLLLRVRSSSKSASKSTTALST